MSEAVKVVSRTQAVNTVVNAIGVGREAIQTEAQLVDKIEGVVCQSGGEEDRKASVRTLAKTLKVAEELGLIRIHRQVAVERIK
jgi:hypothetical protein